MAAAAAANISAAATAATLEAERATAVAAVEEIAELKAAAVVATEAINLASTTAAGLAAKHEATVAAADGAAAQCAKDIKTLRESTKRLEFTVKTKNTELTNRREAFNTLLVENSAATKEIKELKAAAVVSAAAISLAATTAASLTATREAEQADAVKDFAAVEAKRAAEGMAAKAADTAAVEKIVVLLGKLEAAEKARISAAETTPG